MELPQPPPDQVRTLATIVQDITFCWSRTKPTTYEDAKIHLEQMNCLKSQNDYYGLTPGHLVINNFLSFTGKWSGPTAKRLKRELNQMIGIVTRAEVMDDLYVEDTRPHSKSKNPF